MHTETLVYQADGLTMRGCLCLPDAGGARLPGVLVFPDAFGLGDHARTRAARLAEVGYAALACDLHGEGALLTDPSTAMGLIGQLRANPAAVRARAKGGLDALIARDGVNSDQIAAIGFCFGGTMALELARCGAAIAGTVGFHSGLATLEPDDAKNIRGKVLVCIGAEDPSIDAAQRQSFAEEMFAGKVEWQMNLYGGAVHGFTNPASDAIGRPEFARYDPVADARSWAEMLRLFEEIFAAP